jgi:predicted PurR-regulated permease PerM
MAMIFAILTHPFVRMLRKMKLPKWLITPIIVILTVGFIFGLYKLLESAGSEIALQWDQMAVKFIAKIELIIFWLNENLALQIPSLDEELFQELWNLETMSGQFDNVAGLIGSVFGFVSFFILYFFLFVAGINDIDRYLNYVEGSEAGSKLYAYYEVMQSSISSYMVIKAVISSITALLTLSVCWFYGLEFLIFITLTTFFLNFIPNIGSIIASLIPILIGFIQFEYLQDLILLSILIVSIQVVMGNIIEPVVMGDKNKINTVTILFGLLFWGFIWGIPGMILSVPLLVMMKMILEQFELTATFARIMGTPD